MELGRKLDALAAENLYRSVRQLESAQGPVVRINGQGLVNFSSNDYLGLASAPELKVAAIQAIEKYGTGAGASRLICGSLPPHQELDEAIASF